MNKFNLLLFIYLAFSSLAIGQWVQINEPGRNIVMINEQIGYCQYSWSPCPSPSCGSNSVIYKTSNEWAAHSSSTNVGGSYGCCSFYRIDMINDSNIIAIYYDYGVATARRLKDGVWSSTDVPIGDYSSEIYLFDSSTYLFARSMQDSVLFYKVGLDSQNTQRVLLHRFDSTQASAIDIETDQTSKVFMILEKGNNRHLLSSADTGTTWQNILSSTETFRTIQFTPNNLGYMITNNGNIFISIDSGNTWTSQTQLNISVSSAGFANDSVGILGTNSGSIYVTSDYGQNWTQQSVPTNALISNIQFVNGIVAYIEDGGGNLFKNSFITSLKSSNQENTNVEFYPNPSQGQVSIKSHDQIDLISIYSIEGKLLQEIKPINQHFTLPENKGVYLLKYSLKNGKLGINKIVRSN